MSVLPYYLVIVESPAKCGKIEKYLGSQYKCLASFGHFRSLTSLDNIDVNNNYKPIYTNIESKNNHLTKLRTYIKGAKEVIIATDDDREGEAIGWHICDTFNLSPSSTKRIIFNEITKSALTKAIKNPTVLNMNIVNAQKARQILDLIVGFRISPILWNKVSRHSNQKLSAGRCQTPALGIIYDNYITIKKTPGNLLYTTTGYFTKLNLPFVLSYNHAEYSDMVSFLENSVNHDHIITISKERTMTKKAPKPFSTSSLQQNANTELRISPKETMRLCQKLYEQGYITYMRTDSKTYSKDFILNAKKHITKVWGEKYISKNIDTLSERSDKNSTNNAQEAHEAIRPTDIERDITETSLLPKEIKMYKLILHNTLESCMENAKYKGITCKVSSYIQMYDYKYTSEQVVFPGWKIVRGYEKENNIYAYLLNIKNNTSIEYNTIESKSTLKDIKSHYTEAKLVQLLEEKGIGRPSTFSSLVDKIQERGYVKKENVQGKKMKCIDFKLTSDELIEHEHEREFGNEKNKLVIQNLGIIVYELLIEEFNELFNYEYTKNMELELDKIAQGSIIWHLLCESCNNMITTLSKKLNITEKISIQIDKHHRYIIGKYGPVIAYSKSDTITFKPVKQDLDINKLKLNQYTLDEIIEHNPGPKSIGTYNNQKVYLKKGKYGLYLQYGTKTKSITDFDESQELTQEQLKNIIETNTNIIRTINNDASIRKSKHGYYIYYKSANDTKPKFITLANFKLDILTCDISDINEYFKKYI